MTDAMAAAIVSFMLRRARDRRSAVRTAAAVLFGSTMELAALPAVFLCAGRLADGLLGWGPMLPPRAAAWAAGASFLVGVPWLAASIHRQHVEGRGTPFPLVPTHKLVVAGPYRYTRNPMAFGAVFWLLGWAFLANRLGVALAGVGGFSALVLSYDHWIEEKELAARFGADYERYRRATPFFFPRRPR